jgi:hypothetical protein
MFFVFCINPYIHPMGVSEHVREGGALLFTALGR